MDQMKKRVAFHTLGCKVNQYDTEAVAGLFQQRGYLAVDFSQTADVYVINTCTVTSMGERKSRQIVRRAVRQNPDAVVVVMGCYAQVAPGEVADIEGVDLVVGTNEKNRIVDLIEEFMTSGESLSFVNDVFTSTEFEDIPLAQFTGRTRATIKIQEGCNEFCTYCKIPYARGRSRSRYPDSILEEIKRLEQAGFREVVLTGIHMGAYGRDLEPKVELADLLERISRATSIPRIRISSIDPHEVTERFVDVLKGHSNLCRHLHIPLQGGHNRVLESMRRRYTLEEYRSVVGRLKEALPDIAITTDIIVGFPGETEEEFESSLRFVEEMGFSRLHVFKYSKRAGTPAAKMPMQVPSGVKQARSQRMIELGSKLSAAFHSSLVGKELEVLLEQKIPAGSLPKGLRENVASQMGENTDVELWEGLTDNYVRTVTAARGHMDGRLVTVRFVAADSELAIGQLQFLDK